MNMQKIDAATFDKKLNVLSTHSTQSQSDCQIAMMYVGYAFEEDNSLMTRKSRSAFIDIARNDKRVGLRQSALTRTETILLLMEVEKTAVDESEMREMMRSMTQIINDNDPQNFTSAEKWSNRVILDEMRHTHHIALRVISAGLGYFPKQAVSDELHASLTEYSKNLKTQIGERADNRLAKNLSAAQRLINTLEKIQPFLNPAATPVPHDPSNPLGKPHPRGYIT
ncbi:MAG: hypothetical protein WC521_08080 [Bdellovibrionales bacterium]